MRKGESGGQGGGIQPSAFPGFLSWRESPTSRAAVRGEQAALAIQGGPTGTSELWKAEGGCCLERGRVL